ILSKLEYRFRNRKACLPRSHRRQPLAVSDRVRKVGAMSFYQLWFVIKQIELRRGAALEHVNHPLRLRRKMRQSCKTARRARIPALRDEVALQQFRQGNRADTDAGLSKKLPPAQIQQKVCARIHSYSFITVSFKLRIRLVTLVYAASSPTARLLSRGYSPYLNDFRTGSG